MSCARELILRWIEAFQSCDAEAVAEFYSDDAVNFQVAMEQPAIGKEQIKLDTIEFFKGFPDAWSKVENIIADGDWAAWEWVGGGTFSGEFYGSQPTGKSFEIRGCGFLQFKNGKIICQRGYWDKLSWFSQVGIEIE